jgi:two-component system, OmpR family, sensor histidine kinase BaeS
MRTRIILSFVLVVLVSVGSFVLILRQSAEREVGAFMFRGGMVGLESVVDALEDYYRTNRTWEGVENLFPASVRTQGRHGMGMGGMMTQNLKLADPNGRLLFDSQNDSLGQLTQAELDRAVALKNGRRTVGYLLYQTGTAFTVNDQTNLVERLTRAAVIAGLAGGGLSLLLAILLTYRLARPIEDLKRSAQQVAAGNLSQRVRVVGKDELSSLGTAFNQMAESLQRSEVNRQAMTADIAHELRTPLAVQRAHLEAIEDGLYPMSEENLQPILAQNLLLTRLVDDLRTLALADAGQLSLNVSHVDLLALIREVIARFTPQTVTDQIELVLVEPSSPLPPIQADPTRIGQIISNLITNALRHTPSGGKITLSMEQNNGRLLLSVHDTGPGIPPHSLDRIFDRFYRADTSRSREEGGTGLGLSIARYLARAHGGDLSAANGPDGGAVFILTLPTHPNLKR